MIFVEENQTLFSGCDFTRRCRNAGADSAAVGMGPRVHRRPAGGDRPSAAAPPRLNRPDGRAPSRQPHNSRCAIFVPLADAWLIYGHHAIRSKHSICVCPFTHKETYTYKYIQQVMHMQNTFVLFFLSDRYPFFQIQQGWPNLGAAWLWEPARFTAEGTTLSSVSSSGAAGLASDLSLGDSRLVWLVPL